MPNAIAKTTVSPLQLVIRTSPLSIHKALCSTLWVRTKSYLFLSPKTFNPGYCTCCGHFKELECASTDQVCIQTSHMAGLGTKTLSLRPLLQNRSPSLNHRQAAIATIPSRVSKLPPERRCGGRSFTAGQTADRGLMGAFDFRSF